MNILQGKILFGILLIYSNLRDISYLSCNEVQLVSRPQFYSKFEVRQKRELLD